MFICMLDLYVGIVFVDWYCLILVFCWWLCVVVVVICLFCLFSFVVNLSRFVSYS